MKMVESKSKSNKIKSKISIYDNYIAYFQHNLPKKYTKAC